MKKPWSKAKHILEFIIPRLRKKQTKITFYAPLCMAHFLYTTVRAPIVIQKRMMPADIFFSEHLILYKPYRIFYYYYIFIFKIKSHDSSRRICRTTLQQAKVNKKRSLLYITAVSLYIIPEVSSVAYIIFKKRLIWNWD